MGAAETWYYGAHHRFIYPIKRIASNNTNNLQIRTCREAIVFRLLSWASSNVDVSLKNTLKYSNALTRGPFCAVCTQVILTYCTVCLNAIPGDMVA